MTIKLLIADDHEMVREGLEVMIRKIEDLEVVGEATNGEELVQLTRKLQPDVVLTDVRMPKMDGVQATRIIKEEFPHIGVIALSSFEEESLIMDMVNAGARGYPLKNASKAELTDAVKAAYRDEPYYCKQANIRLAQMIARGGRLSESKKESEQFTERELQVIQLICEGLSSKQIAAKLDLKTRTVERYRDAIMEKMEVSNAAALVMFAVQHGLYKQSAIEKK